jgi:hypothetical protein
MGLLIVIETEISNMMGLLFVVETEVSNMMGLYEEKRPTRCNN